MRASRHGLRVVEIFLDLGPSSGAARHLTRELLSLALRIACGVRSYARNSSLHGEKGQQACIRPPQTTPFSRRERGRGCRSEARVMLDSAGIDPFTPPETEKGHSKTVTHFLFNEGEAVAKPPRRNDSRVPIHNDALAPEGAP